MAEPPSAPFQQDQYWIERHKTYAGDARSVGNIGLSHEDNLRGDRALAAAVQVLLRETGARSIIDLGCGYGRICRAIEGGDLQYLGIDISPIAIETARSTYPDRKFAIENLSTWKPRERADLVLCIYTLSTFTRDDEWCRLLAKAASAVGDGGYLVICDHMPLKTQMAAQHVTFRSSTDIASELSKTGFRWNDRLTIRVAKEMGGGLALDFRIASKIGGGPSHVKRIEAQADQLITEALDENPSHDRLKFGLAELRYMDNGSRLSLVIPGPPPQSRTTLVANGEACVELQFIYDISLDKSNATLELDQFWGFVWHHGGGGKVEGVRFGIHIDEVGTIPFEVANLRPPNFKGKIETSPPNSIRGWAIATDWPQPLELRMEVNGVPLFKLRASTRRADLARNNIANEFGGFQLDIPYNPLPNWNDSEARIDLFWASSNHLISTTSKSFGGLPKRKIENVRWSMALSSISADKRNLSIIIPVYNASNETRRCIESLIRFIKDERAEIIVVDDRSSDPDIAPMLHSFQRDGFITVIRNEENLGFSGSVNKGIVAASFNDVLLLNSDTIVPVNVIRQLRVAAYSARRVGTVTPLSNNAGPFSIQCNLTKFSSLEDVDQFSRLVRQVSLGLLPRVPTGHGFCMYVRRDCLDEIGAFDADAFPQGYGEENEFCMRAVRGGWLHLMDDRSFVLHIQGASFSSTKAALLARGRRVVDSRFPEYTSLVRKEFSSSEIAIVGSRVKLAFPKAGPVATVARPRILFVISKETGGTPQTNIDLMSRLQEDYETFILRCDGASIYLESFDGNEKRLIEAHKLVSPVDAVSHRSSEYDCVVIDWLVSWAIDIVHIRHLGWHGLGLIEAAKDLGIRRVFSFHDFYVVCPTIKLLDNDRRYCAGNCTSGDGICKVELWRQDQFPHLKHRWVVSWKSIFASSLDLCDAFVTTSEYAKKVISSHFPSISDKSFSVIRHGRDFQRFYAGRSTLDASDRLRILLPGNIGVAKGSELIGALTRLDVGRELEFHVIGNVDKNLEVDGVTLHGSYDRGNATQLFHEIKPHIGAIFSIWPETYCHTLTELWSAGVPTIGFDIGAVGERLKETGAGWRLPICSAEELFKELLSIKKSPDDYATKCLAVISWQEREGAEYGTEAMAARYKEVYNRVLLTRS